MSEEEEQNAVELKTGEECLMNCEVALILDRNMIIFKQCLVIQVFEKSQQYIKRISRYKNADAVRQVREILSKYQLVEFELWVLGNLCPETANEAKSIVPSITTKERGCTDENIEKMLGDLSLIKKIE
ncbi:hypothetical protein MKW94_009679 [Papaver nudicaule]|uniref:RNA polymerase Rpb4/RPC9 core domain-containing protein n=1 Tax=Papaver nudicaule TaxID=74823 RepID=A0AA41VY78_PAPNU|nr:hypothetical protein [Papaver nudicaule]